MKHYEVAAKCGHVGRNHYIIKCFYVYAKNGKEAAKIVRKFPRVKHNQKYAIVYVREIDSGSYQTGLIKNKHDMYFLVHSSSEQREKCCFKDFEIYPEIKEEQRKKRKDYQKQILKERLIIKEWPKEIKSYYEQN